MHLFFGRSTPSIRIKLINPIPIILYLLCTERSSSFRVHRHFLLVFAAHAQCFNRNTGEFVNVVEYHIVVSSQYFVVQEIWPYVYRVPHKVYDTISY